MKHLLLLVAIVALTTGCAIIPSTSDITFHYKPNKIMVGGPTVPVRVAVLPFKDGTENFTILGSMFDAESLTFNLAKSGIAGIITPLTPEMWAKALADDMAASGSFRAVRFIYSPTELSGEDFYIEGKLEKAYAAGGFTKPSEYVLWLQAVRRSDNRPAWEKRVTRELLTRKSDFDPCGTNIHCMADRSHEGMNLVMQGMFAEARADFMASQGFTPGGIAVLDTQEEGSNAPPLDQESVDETIEKILKGK
jgi:hypothetical protein